MSQASRELNIPRTNLRRWYASAKSGNGTSIKRFIVTYAQNNTPVHLGFLESIQCWMKKWDAELICYRGRYKNPTDQFEANNMLQEEWWAEQIRPFMLSASRNLNDSLVIFPALTQPTAEIPLSGYDSHTGSMSGIFPHPKIQFKTVPTPGKSLPKILTTTGAITLPNYSESKAGAKALHHHVIGAVIVEIESNKIFHMRHILAESDGSFYDIAGGKCNKYDRTGVTRSEIDVLTKGDIHFPFIDQNVMEASRTLITDLQPSTIYLHDVIDFWAQNHHSTSDRFQNAAKYKNDMMSVKKEMKEATEWVKNFARPLDYETVIVSANHNDALDKWLNIGNIDILGINAEYFHWLSYHKHASEEKISSGFKFRNMLEFAFSEHIDLPAHNIRFLGRDVPEVRNGIDYSMHGDVGTNGSRGSAQNISKIGVKSVIGHSHSPSIYHGCYQVGVNCIIPLGYAKGPSGWLTTDCITYKNGKRTLIHFINGKYCL